MYNSGIAHDISYHPKKRMDLFRALSPAEQEATFEDLSPYIKQSILSQLKDSELVDLLNQMDLDRAQKTLMILKDQKRRKKIILRLKSELREKAEYFLRFHPKAALSLLNFNYLLLSAQTSIEEAADAIEAHHKEEGRLPEILVHEGGNFVGEMPFSSLVRESNSKELGSFLRPLKSVSYRADIKEIIELFKSTKHGKIAVLDKDGSVIGVIYSDDAIALFGSNPAEALYDFAGVSASERSFDSVGTKVRHRYKWLIINLATAFLAASVVSLFEETISQLVVLAIYMPIVAGMGGNAATQTLAVIVRGIAVGEISFQNGRPVILREIGAGFVNGLINGSVVALVATLWNGSPLLGVVLAAAMIFNLVVAGFFGAFIPLAMKAMGKDPATSATIFITTATDVFGFFAFLGLASLILL